MWSSPHLTRAYAPPAVVPEGAGPGDPPPPQSLGLHWVDDLAVECVADVTSQQGELSLLLVRRTGSAPVHLPGIQCAGSRQSHALDRR